MTNQQGAPEAPSHEHQRAIMEGERNASLDAYSRVVYLTQTESRIYEAAFTNGWNRHAALVEAQQPTPSAAAPVGEAPLPLLVRDIAADLGTTPIQVCTALAQLGFGGHSVNMAVTPRMAKSLRAHFASTTPQADSAPAEAVQRIVHLRADRERRVYVAGPMTGLPEYNFPMFNATAARLRSEGWHVENPAEHGHVDGAGWSDYLRWDISRIATCGAIYLLPGWSKSKGATLEVHIAGVLGLQVLLADGAEAPQADSQPAPAGGVAAGPTLAHIAAMERAWLWMENQADAQSKGGHATFDLMMLREERDALRAAIDAAASAGSEPVARADSWTNDQWIDLAQRHANADWDSDTPDGYLNAVKALCNDFAAANHSPPEGMVGGWIALPGALPEPGVPVLLDIGKKYPIRAMWAAKHTVQACDDDTDWGEYVEEDDMYYAPEGWYEWNQCEDNHWRVTETPRAWAPLPPTTSAGSRKGE